MTNAIEVADLVKIYGSLRAVDGISFEIEPGQIFGMLGPNGAGKSTTVEIVEGLRQADSGRVEVLGIDVRRHPRQVKERIGVQLQSTAFYKQLSARQLLRLFASFFAKSLPVESLIAMVNLEEKADAPSDSLSGGQRQRLAIAVALVNDPAIVFLDEPTTGLDPQARRSLWDVISRLRAEGKTVLLTTHYLEEAERLCDRLVVIDHGKVIATGTPAGLIAEHFERSAVEFAEEAALPLETLEKLPAVDRAEQRNGQSILFSTDSPRTGRALLEAAGEAGVHLKGLSIRTATLEDVFLKLTGRRIRE
jgi:ABC-2 type transport system ATP-binding protein